MAVKTHSERLVADTGVPPIIPGMVASVDILTGKMTVLDHVLKPIHRARHEALRER